MKLYTFKMKDFKDYVFKERVNIKCDLDGSYWSVYTASGGITVIEIPYAETVEPFNVGASLVHLEQFLAIPYVRSQHEYIVKHIKGVGTSQMHASIINAVRSIYKNHLTDAQRRDFKILFQL